MTCSGLIFGQSYPPAAGLPGSTAIAYNNPIFVGWATHIEVERGYVDIGDTSVYYGPSNKATFGIPSGATGMASNITTDAVSLGDSGIAIVTFGLPIKNGIGPDFAIFENGLSDTFLELAHVEVSSDGINYFRFPSHSQTQTNTPVGGFGTLDPTYLNNLAGKYKVGYGTPFDLDELINSNGLDLNLITHIKIIDVVGSLDEHGTQDSFGNIINDLYPTPFGSGGFDLNGVGVIHQNTLHLSTETINFSIYPNPSHGLIHIDLNNSKALALTITNSIGKQVKQVRLEHLNGSLSFQLSKGIYFIKVSGINSVNSRRVVVQ